MAIPIPDAEAARVGGGSVAGSYVPEFQGLSLGQVTRPARGSVHGTLHGLASRGRDGVQLHVEMSGAGVPLRKLSPSSALPLAEVDRVEESANGFEAAGHDGAHAIVRERTQSMHPPIDLSAIG